MERHENVTFWSKPVIAAWIYKKLPFHKHRDERKKSKLWALTSRQDDEERLDDVAQCTKSG